MKHHLYRVIQDHHLTREEMVTLLARISAVLNSRPLTPPSKDPSDPGPLTPGHFLIGQPMTTLPEPDVTNLKDNTLDKWLRVRALFQKIWKRWSTEYLNELQKRSKWTDNKENIKTGQVVLMKDDNLPPLKWKMGRIVQAIKGQDGKVRKVQVRTSDINPDTNKKAIREFEIAIAKVCPLNIDSPWESNNLGNNIKENNN